MVVGPGSRRHTHQRQILFRHVAVMHVTLRDESERARDKGSVGILEFAISILGDQRQGTVPSRRRQEVVSAHHKDAFADPAGYGQAGLVEGDARTGSGAGGRRGHPLHSVAGEADVLAEVVGVADPRLGERRLHHEAINL